MSEELNKLKCNFFVCKTCESFIDFSISSSAVCIRALLSIFLVVEIQLQLLTTLQGTGFHRISDQCSVSKQITHKVSLFICYIGSDKNKLN